MKKKILIGAFALVSILAGTFAVESFTGSNEAQAYEPATVRAAIIKYHDTYGVIIDCNDSGNDKCII